MVETSGPRSQTTNGRYAMSRKRLLGSIVGLSLLAIGVTACGGTKTVTKTVTVNNGNAVGGSSTGKTVTIIASVPPTDHGWLGAISKDAKAAAAQYKDVKFELL